MTEPFVDSPQDEVETASAWRALIRNFGTLVVGEGAARVFGLVTIIVLARSLGPEGYGVASVGIALVGWMALVADSGTEMLTVRNVSREPARFREIAEKILGLRLAATVLLTFAYVLGVWIFANSPSNRAVYLTFVLTLPAFALNLRWIAVAIGGARAVSVGNVAARVTFMLGVLIFVAQNGNLSRVPYAYAGGELAYALVILTAIAPKHGLLRPRVDLTFWRETLRESLPLMISSLARGLLFAFDLLLIGLLLGPGDAGIFSAGSKPVSFLTTAVSLFYVSFVSSYSAASARSAPSVLLRSVRTSVAVTLPLALVLTLVAQAFVPIVFGDRFKSAAAILAILAWKLPFSSIAAPYAALLLSEGRTVLLMRNTVAGAAVSIVGNSIAVPVFGIKGAAVVNVFTVATIFTLHYRTAVSRSLGPTLRALVARA